MFDAAVILNNMDYLLWGRLAQGEPGGLLLTILMSLTAGAISLALGIPMGLAAWAFPGPVRHALFWWADLIRGIPLIFVIFWVYFLLPAVLGQDTPSTVSVILALAGFTSAAVMYSTLSGLEALPKGQTEAALAAGMSKLQILRWVLLPQALTNILPSFVGLFITLIKDTSLAFILNVTELTTVAGQVNNRTQLYPTEIFLFVAALYYLLCSGLSWGGHRLAKHR